MKIKPLNDRVLIQPLEAESTTAGGIVLPDSAKEKPIQGKVVAVGAGNVNDDGSRCELGVKVGDQVFYGKYAGSDVTIEGKELKIMRESDILAKVN